MKVAAVIRRVLGLDKDSPPHTQDAARGSLEAVTDEAARARVRLGHAMDQWSREEIRLRDRQRPSDVFRVGH